MKDSDRDGDGFQPDVRVACRSLARDDDSSDDEDDEQIIRQKQAQVDL